MLLLDKKVAFTYNLSLPSLQKCTTGESFSENTVSWRGTILALSLGYMLLKG